MGKRTMTAGSIDSFRPSFVRTFRSQTAQTLDSTALDLDGVSDRSIASISPSFGSPALPPYSLHSHFSASPSRQPSPSSLCCAMSGRFVRASKYRELIPPSPLSPDHAGHGMELTAIDVQGTSSGDRPRK
jgi:hypothetical protein